MTYHLAVDFGASSGRHILAHIEGGKIITEEIYRFANAPIIKNTARGEEMFWDTDRLFNEIINGLKKAKELGKIPVTVGVDTWGVDYVLLDGNDQRIGDAYCYRDGRTTASRAASEEKVSAEEMFARTGIAINNYNTVYQLYDDKCTGRLENAKTLLLLPDYFHYRLTGVKAQEYCIATTSGLVNANTHTWDQEIIERLGLKKDLFTNLTKPGTCIGKFSPEVEAAVGFSAAVVLPCSHDTASAVLAAPLKGRTPYISSGTWSLLGVEQAKAYTALDTMKSGYSNEGCYDLGVRLQKNIMGLWMIQQVRHETGDRYDFATLAQMAESSPVDAVIDVNDNRFLAPKNMTAEIQAAAGRELSLGETAFVIFDSLARSYAKSLDDLEALTGEKYTALNIIGGGSKNEFLNRLTKKYTKKKIITGPTEGTALGNLMMQMIGYGALSSVAEGRKMVIASTDIKEV